MSVGEGVETGAVPDEEVEEGKGEGFREGGGAMDCSELGVTDFVDVDAALKQEFAHIVMPVFDRQHQEACFTVEGVVEEGVVVLEKGDYSGDVPRTGGLYQAFPPRGIHG